MVHRLPPLNSLRLFEVAGRRSSFKLAAEELDITASAVSHGIQSLEDWLGVPLFVRSSRALGLTDAGASYLPAVQKALALLASATDQVPSSRPRSRLAMSVTPTFASRILLPRLTRFTSTRPSLRIDLDTSYRTVGFPQDGFDIAIRLGKGSWSGVAAVPLLNETLVPVCSPALLQARDLPISLCDAPLIHLTRVAEDWNTWARITGYGSIDCKRGLMVDSIQMTIDAAVQGLGIALGHRPIVDHELDTGALVTIGLPTARSEAGYWLVGLPETLGRPDIVEFRQWLRQELAEFQVAPPAEQSNVARAAS
jgi:LysR family transcriptional regulator, glycine cleavage system transcriptional activator